MTERKWTPGPWEAVVENRSSCDWIWIGPISWATRVARVVLYKGEVDQQEANANLIAAAPDLYEALDDVMLNGLDDHNVGMVAAALAKARGEQ